MARTMVEDRALGWMSTSASKLAITILSRCFSSNSSLSTQRDTSLQRNEKEEGMSVVNEEQTCRGGG